MNLGYNELRDKNGRALTILPLVRQTVGCAQTREETRRKEEAEK